VDLDKTSKILIAELRAGTIGNITLETPEIVEKELLELSLFKDRKAAKKTARKKKWKNSR
jgi:ribosome biogenesis GTPase A